MKRKHKIKKTKFRMFYATVLIAIFLTSSVSAITIKKETNDNEEPNISACSGSITLAKITMDCQGNPMGTYEKIAKPTTSLSGSGAVTIKVQYDMVARGTADWAVVEIYEGKGFFKTKVKYVETHQEHKTGTLKYSFFPSDFIDEEYYFSVKGYCHDYYGALQWSEQHDFKIETWKSRSVSMLDLRPYGIFWYFT